MTDEQHSDEFHTTDGPPPRYCASCGEIFAEPAARCPNCRRVWSVSNYLAVGSLATLLSEFRGLHDAALIGDDCYATLRRTYERRLLALRPPRRAPYVAAPSVGAPLVPAGRPPGIARTPGRGFAPAAEPARPPRPPRPPGPTLAQWTAARQADILLYLGAFLLSIAALIFVGYQGKALSGPLRFGILLTYTVGFLVLGLALPRWERVREAGAVFLALGAVLVPINFIMLRAQVFNEGQVADSQLLLVGAVVTAGLYFALAARGHSRLYALPGAVATVVAWGALGAVCALPEEWFGAWYVGGLTLGYVALAGSGLTRWSPAILDWFEIAAALIGPSALLYAHVYAVEAGTHTAQLPLAYAVATLGVASYLYVRRSVEGMALLPPLGALAALTAWWSAFGLGIEWYGSFAVAAGLGYVVVARFDLPRRAHAWGLAAVVAGGFGLTLTHLIVATGGHAHASLPVADALATLGVVAYLLARRSLNGVALLPPLLALTALTGCWSAVELDLEWYGSFAVIAALGYLLVAHVDLPYHARSWGFAAATSMALGLLSTHLALIDVDRAHAALPVAYALTLLITVIAYARWRWVEALTALPPAVAALGASAGWAFWEMRPEWLGAWIAGAAAGYLLIAELDLAPGRLRSRIAAGYTAALALTVAHLVAPGAPDLPWQLPVTYGIVLTGAVWDSVRRRDPALLSAPPLGAAFAVSCLWASGVEPLWWGYPWLAAAILIVATEPWWRERPVLRDAGWPFALVPAFALPLGLSALYREEPLHGVVAFTLSAAVFLTAALRSRGALSRISALDPESAPPELEQLMLARVSGGLLMGAAAYFNALLGLAGADRAWAYAGLGVAAWAGLAAFGGLRRDLFGLLAPFGVTSLTLGTWIARDAPGAATIILMLGTAGPVCAALTTRRTLLWVIAAVFGAGAIGFGREWAGIDRALLPLAYAAVAAGLWAGLIPFRRVRLAPPAGAEPDAHDEALSEAERAAGGWASDVERRDPLHTGTEARGAGPAASYVVAMVLTWGTWALALVSAAVLLNWRVSDQPDVVTARTREWAVLTLTVAGGALAVLAEGLRLRLRAVAIGGTAGLLTAALMGIAITEPDNVQAYTLPAGLYLIGLGLSFRRSPELFGAHMLAHESVIALGVLLLALPPAEQSFAPGGGLYSLEVIGIGLLFLAAGFVLASRWLVAGGVLTLSGVAVRWLLLFSERAPYWLTLGLAGTLLLVVGMLLLLQRDRWDRARAWLARWWEDERGQGIGTRT